MFMLKKRIEKNTIMKNSPILGKKRNFYVVFREFSLLLFLWDTSFNLVVVIKFKQKEHIFIARCTIYCF